MSESFDSLLEEMADAGIDSEFIERIRRSTDNSGARKERDAFKAQAEAALAEAKRYQSVVAETRFRDLGIKVKPSVLKTPDDLDWTDDTKVRDWATGAGLIEPPPPEPTPAAVDAHARITDATQGAPAAGGRPDVASLIANARNEAELTAVLQANGVPMADPVSE